MKGESPATNAGVMYYKESKAPLRPITDFINGNEVSYIFKIRYHKCFMQILILIISIHRKYK